MDLQSRIETELALGVRAAAEKNAGRTRVCARRAAGAALKAWYQALEGPGWGGDAMKQLGRLQADETAPAGARAAAERLRTRVDHDHQLPFTNDPLEDARLIIHWALEKLDGSPGTAAGR